MNILPYTADNVSLIQGFLDETRERISKGVEITFTSKANQELQELMLEFEIEASDIEDAIESLVIENYYRGIDPSRKEDFEVCAFYTSVGKNKIDIYLKYGLHVSGLQILLFSNHVPDFPITQPFKN